MDFLLIQTLNGLASASSLFLVASGLSIIFGVTRIVNFAHGSFYMLGAYIAVTVIAALGGQDGFSFWGGILLAACMVAVIGALVEIVILRRIYAAPELFQLLATFGVVLMIQDITLYVWGPEDKLGPRAPGFRSFVMIFDNRFPSYELFLIVVGPVVLLALWLLFNRTRWGTLVRAATLDREMVGALGVNQRLLFTSVFMFGSFLAGLGGALQLPREAVTLHMDLAMITEVFVVVVVGGLGSITGAYLAAVLIGLVHAFGIVYFPKSTLVLAFLVMALVLVVKPYGLLGRKPSGHAARGQTIPEPLLMPADRRGLACRPHHPAAVSGRLRCVFPDRTRDLRAVRGVAAFHDGAGRHAFLRSCRVFRAGRLWRGACGKVAGRTHGCGFAGIATAGRPCRRAVRLVLCAAVGRLSGHADPGLCADRLGDGIPVDRCHGG
jgi:branched-chain amino acid transport system permease protein